MSAKLEGVDASESAVYAARDGGDLQTANGGERRSQLVASDPKEGSVKAKNDGAARNSGMMLSTTLVDEAIQRNPCTPPDRATA